MTAPIVTCTCGAKVRVPASAGGAAFRCPRCKAPLAAPADVPLVPTPAPAAPAEPAAVFTSATLDAGREAICPICQTAIGVGEPIQTCPQCDQVHHSECWQEIGGCGTFGCKSAPAVDKNEQSAQVPLTAWGDTKKCPACGETIKSIAVRCRYCNTDFSSVDPMSAADLRRQAITGEELRSFKNVVVGLFAISIIGCLAPIMVIGAPLYLLPRRAKLAKCGQLFTIMGWFTMGISAFYTFMFLLFLAFGNN